MVNTITGSALSNDIDYSVSEGVALGRSSIFKFGRNYSVGTSFLPVAAGSVYRTPQSSSATTLRIKAGGSGTDSDNALAVGARQVTLEGLDETGSIAVETLSTNGTVASASTTTTFIRLYRAYVSQSGTYATQDSGSHAASIVIENTAGTEDWATILVDGFPLSQTTIAAYTVPIGYTAYVLNYDINVDSNKRADLIFFKREGILDTSAPYHAMRVLEEWGGVSGNITQENIMPIKINELTDIGFLARAETSAEVDCSFELMLVKDGA